MTAEIIIPGIGADGELFPIEKMKAHRDAVFHLAISVFVFDGDALLIQRRAQEKYHCGGLWANTCCTHPAWGESVEASANRRLQEELGFTIPLEKRLVVEYSADVGQGLYEHEKVTVFTADVDRDHLEIRPNPDEVCETRWITKAELVRELADQPEIFTPWFKIYAERFPNFTFDDVKAA